MTTKGVAAPEVGEAYARARELCRQVEETPQLFSVLLGLASFYGMRAENQTAHELAEQCLSLAQSVQDPTSLMWAHAILGATLFFPGEFALAQDHLAQGIALYDPQKHNPFVSGAGQDSKGVCLSYAAWALWLLGYPDQALQSSQEALTLAQELSHPYSLACAMNTVARLHQFRRERQAAQERAEALVAFSSNRGFPAGLAPGMVYWGWVLAEQGHGEGGIAKIHQGLAIWQTTGGEALRSYYLALLADAQGQVGQPGKGLAALAEALDSVQRTDERFYEAELYRLKGELTLAQARVQRLGSSVTRSSRFKVQGSKLQSPSTQPPTPEWKPKRAFGKP